MNRFAVLRERNFRVFFAGYTTSQLGSAMATVALAFAVLDNRGSPTDLSWVLAARILPLVLFLLGGGLLGDRLPRRIVMLSADMLRLAGQGGIAALFFAGHPPLWALLALAAATGVGEAAFTPSMDGLVPSLVPAGRLTDANALTGLARSVTTVAGPALAGILVAVAGPAVVLALDAASYAASVLALARLRIPAASRVAMTSVLGELRAGWTEFRSRTWLWVMIAQVASFNLLLWAPFLVLGPAEARLRYGGAGSWGVVWALFGGGAVLGGLLLLGRHPRRPLVLSAIAGLGYTAPAAALALHAPLPVVCAGALLAGLGSGTSQALFTGTLQREVPEAALSRVSSYTYLGAFAMGPVGLALAGPIGQAVGMGTVLACGAAWHVVTVLLTLTVPSVRRQRTTPAPTAAPAPSADPARGGTRPEPAPSGAVGAE